MSEPRHTPARAPAYWTDARLSQAASTLRGRATILRADIARELRKHDAERFGLLAANVADSAEAAVADLIGDIYLAEIDRDVMELRDVEGALKRVSVGTYGTCLDCAQPIDPKRLELNPHVARCLPCQTTAEQSRQGGAQRSTTL